MVNCIYLRKVELKVIVEFDRNYHVKLFYVGTYKYVHIGTGYWVTELLSLQYKLRIYTNFFSIIPIITNKVIHDIDMYENKLKSVVKVIPMKFNKLN